MTFGQQVRTERESRSMTLTTLAGLAGINERTLGIIEMGKANPRLDNARRIARALRVTVGYLLGETVSMPLTNQERAVLAALRNNRE